MNRIKYFQKINNALKKYDWQVYQQKVLNDPDSKCEYISGSIQRQLLRCYLSDDYSYGTFYIESPIDRIFGQQQPYLVLKQLGLITIIKLKHNMRNDTPELIPFNYKITLTKLGIRYMQYILGDTVPHHLPLNAKDKAFLLNQYNNGKDSYDSIGKTKQEIYTPEIKRLLRMGLITQDYVDKNAISDMDGTVETSVTFGLSNVIEKYTAKRIVPKFNRIINERARRNGLMLIGSLLCMLISGLTYFFTLNGISGALCVAMQLLFLWSLFCMSPFHHKMSKLKKNYQRHDSKYDLVQFLIKHHQYPQKTLDSDMIKNTMDDNMFVHIP